MIDIPDLGKAFYAMWQELLYLAANPPAPWTLIGAHMVALHGWKMGRKQPRASRDADILVNARVVSNGTERVSQALLSRGFSMDGVSPEGVGHRFVNGEVRLDILGPDGVGARTGLFTSYGARTVEVPGGSQALLRTVMFEIRVGKISGMVPVANLLGSILVKVRAIAVDEQPDAQRCCFPAVSCRRSRSTGRRDLEQRTSVAPSPSGVLRFRLPQLSWNPTCRGCGNCLSTAFTRGMIHRGQGQT